MGTIFTAAGWVTALILAEITASCLIRITAARFSPDRQVAVPDRGLMLAEITGGGFLAILAALGISPHLSGVLAALAFCLATVQLAKIARRAATQGQGGQAARRTAGRVLAELAGTARYFFLRDLGSIASRRTAEGAPAASPAGGVPGWASPARARNVPHLLDDPHLGAHPFPADIAANLELDRVPVPPHWDRLAQVISDFESEDDDDLAGHMTGEAAGVLTAAAAIENRTENLAAARGLDPAIIAAHFDIAEGFAELATRYALLVRRDHLVHGEVREWRDNGGVLPHGAREWFDAGAPGDGGRAA